MTGPNVRFFVGRSLTASGFSRVHSKSANSGVPGLILDLRFVVQAPRISSPTLRTEILPKRSLPSLQVPL